MVKENKTRIYITLTKKKAQWLQKAAARLDISVSKLSDMLISQNLQALRYHLSDLELEEIIRIAKTPWLD